jgi:hypothetical protein
MKHVFLPKNAALKTPPEITTHATYHEITLSKIMKLLLVIPGMNLQNFRSEYG